MRCSNGAKRVVRPGASACAAAPFAALVLRLRATWSHVQHLEGGSDLARQLGVRLSHVHESFTANVLLQAVL